MNPRIHRLLRHLWKGWIRPFAIALAVLGTFRSAVADWYDVPTGSMRPTIIEGDRILVNKAAFGLRLPFTRHWLVRWDAPVRGDIVVLHSPADGTRLVKRIVALPGDVIELRANALHLNGRPVAYGALDENTLAQLEPGERPGHFFASERIGRRPHAVMGTPGIVARRSFGPVTVPEGFYFVLGDNRDESADSRYFGFVRATDIVGRSSRIAFSLDRDGYYLPRPDRFLRPLP